MTHDQDYKSTVVYIMFVYVIYMYICPPAVMHPAVITARLELRKTRRLPTLKFWDFIYILTVL
jgi:hypothetical protein